MVRAVESIPKQLLKEKKVISRYVDNIALEAHNVNSETFLGITCMSFAPQTRRGVYNEDSFSCTSHGNHSDEVPEGKVSISCNASCFCVHRVCVAADAMENDN